MQLTMKNLWDKYACDPQKEGFTNTNKSIKVLGVDPSTGKVEKVKVVRLLRKRPNKVYQISLDCGKQFLCDETHRLVKYDNLTEELTINDLFIGDKLPVINESGITSSAIINISELSDYDDYVYDVELDKYHLFVHSQGVVSHNCRLRSDTTKMKEFFNSLGSGGVKIGSHRVCTINLPRLAHNSTNLDDFINKLIYKMKLVRDILKEHRELLEYEIEQGLLPLYTLGFMDLKTQFSTVGIIGFYEAMEILGYDLLDDNNLEIAKKVIKVMNDMNDKFADEDHVLYNLEQIPGESAAIKLAKKDHLIYDGDMNYSMYSNQFIPLVKNVPLAKRIKAQGVFDASMSGGSILHINLAEKVNSVEMLLTLMNYAVENNVIYFAPNYNMAVCKDGHITIGKVDHCSKCGKPIDYNMLRVVGFYTKIDNWIEERRGNTDYESRVFY